MLKLIQSCQNTIVLGFKFRENQQLSTAQPQISPSPGAASLLPIKQLADEERKGKQACQKHWRAEGSPETLRRCRNKMKGIQKLRQVRRTSTYYRRNHKQMGKYYSGGITRKKYEKPSSLVSLLN